MKTKNVLLSVIASCLFLFSCSKSSDSTNTTPPTAPTANFSWQSSNLTAPSTVVFTNTSTNATSYSWNFGDGNTSTATSPTHLYSTAGTYTVTLTATGTGGNATYNQTITIAALPIAPTAGFTYTGAYYNYAPENFTFTNTSTNATSYSWNFGDGTTSTSANPTHVYTSAGSYAVILTATGTGGTNQISQTVTIAAPATKVVIDTIYINSLTTQACTTNYTGNLNIDDYTGTTILQKWNGYTCNVTTFPIGLATTSGQLYTCTNITNSNSGAYALQFWQAAGTSTCAIAGTDLGSVTFAPYSYTTGSAAYNRNVTITNGNTSMTLYLNWLP